VEQSDNDARGGVDLEKLRKTTYNHSKESQCVPIYEPYISNGSLKSDKQYIVSPGSPASPLGPLNIDSPGSPSIPGGPRSPRGP
jgi:hypothetical protein